MDRCTPVAVNWLDQPAREHRLQGRVIVNNHARVTRRGFLRAMERVLAATGLGVFVAPALAYFWPKSLAGLPSEPVAVGPADSIQPGQSVLVRYGRYPALVINTSAGIRAHSAVCTHFSCIVKWNPKSGMIECPCHAGFYRPEDGTVISGPPPRPLTHIPVSVQGGTLYLDASA